MKENRGLHRILVDLCSPYLVRSFSERTNGDKMKVIEVLEILCDRLQVAMVVAQHDGKSSLTILMTNNAFATMLGYPSSESLVGSDVKDIMPDNYSRDHDKHISSYVQRNPSKMKTSTVLGQWRELEAMSSTGEKIPCAVNVADVKNSEERYFVAIFQDRRKDRKEKESLESIIKQLEIEKKKAQEAMLLAEKAKSDAEDNLLRQKKLSAQVSILKQIFGGTIGLVILMAMLVVIGWFSGNYEKEALAMFERILLVLTGMLGSAMAGVFDSRNQEKGGK